tara:strand:- start:1774 stop:3915 length:2142 start_codon:yes stop_codon:yes gene_type:complete
MSGYIGPIPVPQGIQNKETFTATAGQTTFNTNGYTDGDFINVYLNGVRLINGTDYTATNGSDVVLTQAASVSDVLDFETFNSFSLVSQTFDNLTTKNPTHEDTDGGRESAVSFKGEQSGGEISTLAAIQASHDGTADDQKGDLIFKTNDGSDNNAPTERLRIDSAGSILTATLGTDNVHLGEGAGASIASGGNQNTLIGKGAGTSITTGVENVFVGYAAGDAVTDADYNIGVGWGALGANVLGSKSVAVGTGALDAQNPAGATDMHNTAVGHGAGGAVTTGISNTLIGSEAGDALTDADYNVAIGFGALGADTKGDRSVAIGLNALQAQNFTSVTTTNNTAVGDNAGYAVTTGTANTFVGAKAGDGTDDGIQNVAVGYAALSANAGNNNTAVGESALTSTTGIGNAAFGNGAGNAITSGNKNTVIGSYNGNQNNLDIRTSDNNIVISDGDANPRMFFQNGSSPAWVIGNNQSNVVWPGATSASGSNGIWLEGSVGTLGVTSNASPFYLNKNNADGTLALFYSEGNFEGSIAVSGSTVSYNGGHLSRWSQLADGSKDNTLVKGTVMTNLDKMAVWEHAAVAEGDTIKLASGGESTATADDVADAYTENNEQLNCMAVSSVEGDPNVSGVFVDWDDQDDGYNDLRIAMTGDMVIRIAKGVTIARGDLLMSAGDGTAKPQDDDIVRSKTIAKVTSTNVSHTYDDESYLVPCVLMAC